MQNCFPATIKFKGQWRPYQARVLAELDEHLDDRRLHVIAAPGSGKTILGLEAILRLNRPTLVISPTLAIRDQWIQRLRELFLPEGSDLPVWISTDVRKPSLFTSTTYQALHMAYTGDAREGSEEDILEENGTSGTRPEEKPEKNGRMSGRDFIELLNKAQIETLVVDEAHHLRSEWWKTLMSVHEQLKNVRVVALTATPPYDVSYQEWIRYQEFCGPVDEEISVPELVLDGNLCPHQDYVYLSLPTAKENEQINLFHQEVSAFCKEILSDTKFIEALERHPAIIDTNNQIENILANPEYYSSIVIYLNYIKRTFSHRILSVLGVSRSRIPSLTTEWLEILLTNSLYGDDSFLPLSEEDHKRLKQRISRIGVVERRKVFLKNTKQITKSLMQSMSKIDSIIEIVRLEHDVLKDDLRLAILSDHIRYEDLPRSRTDLKPLNRLGVIPIFEGLRRTLGSKIRLGCLCGTVVIIPADSESILRRIAEGNNIKSGCITFKRLSCDEQYSEVILEGLADEQAVALITRLLTEGGITVLVGTKSLLGEGWDAPCINALILASFVGSFVLSNQMRGRAVRTCKTVKDKTANIWHLVCLQRSLDLPGFVQTTDLGPDWEMIQRRFKAFVGVSNAEPVIENGFYRLGLRIDDPTEVALSNETTIKQAKDRSGLSKKWEDALKRGVDGVRMVQEIEAPKESVPREFIFQNTLRWLMFQGAYWGFYIFGHFQPGGRSMSLRQFFYAYMIVGVISLIVAAPFFIRSAWLYFRYGPVEGSLKQIGEATLKTLTFLNLIKTDPAKLSVATSATHQGWISCYLEGGSSFEKTVFLDALQEVLGPIENPRYIITRNSTFFAFARRDFHVVPEILAEKKEKAEYFEKMWKKYVGPTELIYTRNEDGRKMLIKARNRSLSGQFTRRSERLNVWK
jgi:superfamily II DNA or RNA helicase